jgi:hypothetical protein
MDCRHPNAHQPLQVKVATPMLVPVALVALALGNAGAPASAAPAGPPVAATGVNPPAAPGVKTDLGACWPAAAPALPKAGDVFTDPTFGTTIMRVTDRSDGARNHVAYSYWPAFNKDCTWLTANCDGEPMLFKFDPQAFKLLGKDRLFDSPPQAGGGMPGWEDSIWSGTSPDALYCHEGLRLWRRDVARKEYTLVKDFSQQLPPGHLRQMSKSLDDNVFGFTLQDPAWKVTGLMAWRADTDEIVLRDDREGLDEIQVDKTGRYCLIKTDKQGKDQVQAIVADLETGKRTDLIDDAPDFAPGHSDNGRGLVVGADNWRNAITVRALGKPHEHTLVLDLKNDWSLGCHISLLADDESWALVSFFSAAAKAGGPFTDELVLVATDGSQQVRRLAHHFSVFKEYWDSPRASISRDGRFVVFNSNFGDATRRDVFVLKVPDEATR